MTDRPLHVRLFRMFIGALVGLAFCALAAASGFLELLKDMPAEDIVSTVLALLILMLGGFAVLVSSSQGAYKAIAENYREGDPLDDDVLRMMRMNAILLLISGGLLLAPPFAVRLGAGETASIVVAAAMGALLFLTTWLSWRVTKRSDELTRALAMESSAISFWVLTMGLFGWASMVKLGLAPEISSWTLMTAAMAVSLVVQMGLAMRRGMFA
ncbi:hypothetical protein [Sphingomonas sp. G-3-2-10]|uniref:hypothetical protein n=1 Tax=Sphingomonas sp. G-3-2-10 TaxID=2728838 RepID=UPI00146B1EE2|nr:hypothetical protein [Sphingomonas sp. G-3-2-10]NML07601.1 hypothetical protein [Sphingomonas sp. G-3-2-10]